MLVLFNKYKNEATLILLLVNVKLILICIFFKIFYNKVVKIKITL